MAVQDGYGKSSGSESLVFAYDLKDTINSYRGQPATNIWTSGNPNGHGSGIEIIQTNYFLGKVIDSGVVYRNYLTNPAQSDTGTYYNNGGLNIGSMSFSNLNPSTRYIQISFDYYGVTPYRRFCCSGTGLNGYLGVTSTDSTNDTYGWDTTYSPGSGDDWNNDASRMGYWQKISLIVALRGDKNHSNIWALYIYLDATTQGEGYFANMIFTEHSSFPTGPIRWTSSTRSNTQGLLDLTGNSSIDLSSVSFDSNAQMTFDGTDDWLNIPTTLNAGNFTYETIMRSGDSSYQIFTAGFGNPSGGGTTIQTFVNSSGALINLYAPVGAGGWVYGSYSNISGYVGVVNTNRHIVVVNSGTNWKTYVNGNLVGDVNFYTPSVGNEIGVARVAMQGVSTIPTSVEIVKIYNRVLTSTEITNNYLKYKRQYGLT